MSIRSSAANPLSTQTRWSRSKSQLISLPKLSGLAIIASLALAVQLAPVSASEWIYCADQEAIVDLGFLLGTVDAFSPAAATLRYKTLHWTTSSAYGDGAIMTVGQGFADKTMLIVDLYDEALDKRVAELRLWKTQEVDITINAGTLRILGEGAWSVTCDPS